MRPNRYPLLALLFPIGLVLLLASCSETLGVAAANACDEAIEVETVELNLIDGRPTDADDFDDLVADAVASGPYERGTS